MVPPDELLEAVLEELLELLEELEPHAARPSVSATTPASAKSLLMDHYYVSSAGFLCLLTSPRVSARTRSPLPAGVA